MSRTRTACLLALTLASAALGARVDTAAFQYRLEIPVPAEEDLYALRLPDSLFGVTLDSLADLRLADPAGQAVPFDITRRLEITAVTQQVAVAFRRTGFAQPGDNRIEIVYEKVEDKDAPPQWLTLRTSLRDFEKNVAVEGSQDGTTWTNLVEGAIVFDASRYMDVSRRDVPLPPGAYRFYRVTLHDVTDLQSSPVSEIARYAGKAGGDNPQYTDRQTALHNRDFRVEGIDFYRRDVAESAARAKIVKRTVTALAIRSDEKKQQTIVRFEAGRVPITELTLRTGSRNFSRPCALYPLYPKRGQETAPAESRTLERRAPLASGALRQIAFRTLSETHLTLAFAENRAPAYELVIENGDNPELAVEGIDLRGPELQALFFAKGPQVLRLFAGSPDAEALKFDLTAIRLALDRGLLGRLIENAGALQPNPESRKGGGFGLNRKAALGGALALMVLILGFALFKAMKKMDEPAAPGN